jgi:hypothetical protein
MSLSASESGCGNIVGMGGDIVCSGISKEDVALELGLLQVY